MLGLPSEGQEGGQAGRAPTHARRRGSGGCDEGVAMKASHEHPLPPPPQALLHYASRPLIGGGLESVHGGLARRTSTLVDHRGLCWLRPTPTASNDVPAAFLGALRATTTSDTVSSAATSPPPACANTEFSMGDGTVHRPDAGL
jgi:hypothetical protein